MENKNSQSGHSQASGKKMPLREENKKNQLTSKRDTENKAKAPKHRGEKPEDTGESRYWGGREI